MCNLIKFLGISFTIIVLCDLNLIIGLPVDHYGNANKNKNNTATNSTSIKSTETFFNASTASAMIIKQDKPGEPTVTILSSSTNSNAPVAEALTSKQTSTLIGSPTRNRKKWTPYKKREPDNENVEYLEDNGHEDETEYSKSFENKGKGGYNNFEVYNNKDDADYAHAAQKTAKYPNNKRQLTETVEAEVGEEDDDNTEVDEVKGNTDARSELEIPEEFAKQSFASAQNDYPIEYNDDSDTVVEETPKIKRHNHNNDSYHKNQITKRGYKVHENQDDEELRYPIATDNTGGANINKNVMNLNPYVTGTNNIPNANGYQAFVVHDDDSYPVNNYDQYYEDPEKADTKNTLSTQNVPIYQNFDYPLLNVHLNDGTKTEKHQTSNKQNNSKKPPIVVLRDKIKVDYGDKSGSAVAKAGFNDKYDDIDYSGGKDNAGSQYTIVPFNYEDDVVDVDDDDDGSGSKEQNKHATGAQPYAEDYGYEDDGEGSSGGGGGGGGGGETQQAEYDEYDDDSGEGGGGAKQQAAQNAQEGEYDDYDDGEVAEHAAKKKEEDDDYY